MITRVVHPFNLQRALEHVIANKGSAGVDGVSIRELRKVFSEKKLQLIEAIKQGNYQVQPILAYIIHSGFISGYQNRYGDNLKPPTNVYHRMTA